MRPRKVLVPLVLVLVLATAGLVAALQAAPGWAHLAGGVWALVVAIIGGWLLLRWARPMPPPRSDFSPERRRRRTTEPFQPSQLMEVEAMLLATVGREGDPRRRLAPWLSLVQGDGVGPGPLRMDLEAVEALVRQLERGR